MARNALRKIFERGTCMLSAAVRQQARVPLALVEARFSCLPSVGAHAPDATQAMKMRWGTRWSGFAAAGVTAYSTTIVAHAASTTTLDAPPTDDAATSITSKLPSLSIKSDQPTVVFVLGGPGSGKGTQCSNIVRDYGFVHLSAGDLLRAEIQSGSENGNMIQNMIKEGKIVPSEVTVNLLQKAMKESGKEHFLIDGFPRNEENRAAFERETGISPAFVLFFDCPEDVMEKRLLGRGQGRIDDNIETIRKRFKVFLDSSLPVIDYYATQGKVKKVEATKSVDDVFETIKPFFNSFLQD